MPGGSDLPVMSMVLLRGRVQLAADDVAVALRAFPGNSRPEVVESRGRGNLCDVMVDGRRYSILSMPLKVPRETFSRSLDHSEAAALEPLIDGHKAHIAITSRESAESMGDAVVIATVVHQIAWHLGTGLQLAQPVSAFWATSERLCDWNTFGQYAKGVAGALDDGGAVEFPSRYWVSIQLEKRGDAIGGKSLGLRPIAGYEIELAPIAWPMADVAARLIGTVEYLFTHGAVLKDGETLGTTGEERFRIRRSAGQPFLRLTLEMGDEGEGSR